MNAAADNALIVTLTSKSDPCAFARFTWTWAYQGAAPDCDLLAVGVSDDDLDAMIAAKAHEGADFPGYTVEID